MTKKIIKASDVLGDNYYIYELSSSNYTPVLNGTITITCTVTDVYGDLINNKFITLYKNGTSVSTKTTNSSGVATWSITCSTAGIQSFKVENKAIEVFVDNKSDIGHTHSQYLTEHQSLKTINNESLIGNGNINISVGDNYGTFTELQTLINNTSNGSTLNLDKDYQCQNGENPIQVDNYININGNGHIIDGNNMSNIVMYGSTLYNVKFINCHSDYNGGAIYSFGTMKIDNCLFMNNTGGGSGGALDFESDDSVVTNCVFINNKSQSNGGVLYSECEGYKFINCIFSNNSSDYDGGALWVSPYEDNNVTIKDCIFVDNTANGDGGGIYAYTHEEIKVYNCTFIESSLYNTRNVDYLTSSAITGMLTSSDIADNLTTDNSTKVLSAKQGKALNDLIGQAISYINQ